jgi:DNA-binding transcriptional ArsR family regulator
MQAVLAAVADPTRQQILHMIWDEERSAGDIAEHLPVTFGAVSQHLAVLRNAGVVQVRRDGRQRFYVADRAALGPLAPILETMWGEQLRKLKALSEERERTIRAGGTNKTIKATKATKASKPRKARKTSHE